MTFSELLTYLDRNSGYPVLDGSPSQTLTKAVDQEHQNSYAGEIINCIAEKLKLDSTDRELPERVQVINSLGQLRLKYMADDAPVEGLRTLEKIIATIDSAYNDEALTQKGK